MKKFVLLCFISFLCANLHSQWVHLGNEMGAYTSVYSFTNIGTDIFSGTTNGIYKSTNNGTNWIQIALDFHQVYCFAALGSNLFAGTADSGVYFSSNNGINWVKTSLADKQVYCLTTLGNNLFAGTIDWSHPTGGGIYRSTNNGINWSFTSMNSSSVVSLTVLGTNIFAGTDSNISGSGKIYISTNSGSNWNQTAYNSKAVWALTAMGNNIFAGTYDYGNNSAGVFVTTNNGSNWTQTSLNNRNVLSLTTIGSNIIAGIYDFNNSNGVYLSTNNGTTWITNNQGFNTLPKVRAFLVTSDYIFAGTEEDALWRRPISDIVDIQNTNSEIPIKYSLYQNYPNPFNPITNVKFSIINSGQVKLIVYDVQGREVQTLVNESLKPGTYEAAFDGSMLNSGVYFYKLVTGNFTETKKMVLIK
jgi:hypothetical protein